MRTWQLSFKNTLLISILFFSSVAFATPELDRQYELEKIGFLKSWDNVDGLFADYVSAAYKNYFSKQSRFILQDLSKSDAVLSTSKLPYFKVIDDSEILGQIARSTKTESMIRTKIWKEGPQYRFQLEWLHSPKMEIMATETLVLKEEEKSKTLAMENIKSALEKAVDRMIHQLPFSGAVTGRDGSSTTVNLGSQSGLKRGDTLNIATLDEVKKHPLLKTIVEWKLTPIGKIEIDQVDEAIAFGHITEETNSRPIRRYQKVTQIIPKPIQAPDSKDGGQSEPDSPPRLGFLGAGFGFGGFSRQYNTLDSTDAGISRNGSGTPIGATALGELWLNREWFIDASLAYGFWSYSQEAFVDSAGNEDTSGTVTDLGSSTLSDLRFAVGYSYLLSEDLFGPKGWLKFGYHSISYSLPLSTDQKVGPNSFSSVFVGVGGQLPLRGKYGAEIEMQFGLFKSASETGFLSGAVTAASDVNVFVGGYYRFNPKMMVRAGFDIQSNGADFGTTTSVTERVISFAPSLLYYF